MDIILYASNFICAGVLKSMMEAAPIEEHLLRRPLFFNLLFVSIH